MTGGLPELARERVAAAVADGILTPPGACEMCARTKGDKPTWSLYAHHEDYTRPLDVLWLCGSCHARIHAVHGGLDGYLAWLRAQLADAGRLHERFYATAHGPGGIARPIPAAEAASA